MQKNYSNKQHLAAHCRFGKAGLGYIARIRGVAQARDEGRVSVWREKERERGDMTRR